MPARRQTDTGSFVVTHGLGQRSVGIRGSHVRVVLRQSARKILIFAASSLGRVNFPLGIDFGAGARYSGLGWGGVIASYISSTYARCTGIARVSPTAPGPQQWQYIFYIWGRDDALVVRHLVLPAGFPGHSAPARPRGAARRREPAGIKNKKFKAPAVKDIKLWILFSSLFAAAILNGVVRYSDTYLPFPSHPRLTARAQQFLLDDPQRPGLLHGYTDRRENEGIHRQTGIPSMVQ
ncbi:hypothetical protein FB451DRAFT_1370943 [Mycena latifolia]|nr:hypothetical protein FB451DRAFT_1370943 [Mycena latifolia]